MFNYKKIAVIGCSGAGKSTFSRKLTEITGLPLYYLDMIYWRKDCSHIDRDTFIERQKEILKTDNWIIDGNFRKTLELRISHAELIYFFDLPTEVCIHGAFTRGKRVDMPCDLPADDELIHYIKEYNKNCKPEVLRLFDKYPDKKIIIFHSHSEVDDYLSELKSNMISMEDYKNNPCKVLSIPYWKAKSVSIPSNMKIVHESEFDKNLFCDYEDKRFFRLIHHLKDIPQINDMQIEFEVISSNKSKETADLINRSYTHSEIHVTADYVESWTSSKAYCSDLWIGAVKNGKLIGSIICDFDAEVGEAVIEWLQVLPEYRHNGIATALVSKALAVMREFADFATVSGECDNITNPESVYRKCGFIGNDIWHILIEK